MINHHFHGALGGEHQLACQEPIPDAAQGIQVNPGIKLLRPHGHLGSHIARRARRDSLPGQLGGPSLILLVGFYQAEVQDLDEIEVRTQTGDVYVGRFDVAVEEALLVSVTERMADLL